jgi:hypothetical protein
MPLCGVFEGLMWVYGGGRVWLRKRRGREGGEGAYDGCDVGLCGALVWMSYGDAG